MTLAAKWPKMLLEEEIEAVFEKSVKKYAGKYGRATLRKVFDKLIEKKKKEGKLIVI